MKRKCVQSDLKSEIHKELPVTAEIKKLEYEELYFKSIVLQIENSAKLTALHEKVQPYQQKISTFDPHISLWYGSKTEVEKREQMKQFNPLPQPITFTHARLVIVESGDWKDLSSWRVLS